MKDKIKNKSPAHKSVQQNDKHLFKKSTTNNEYVTSSSSSPTTSSSSSSKLSALQLKFTKKLEGARFRQINEKLYTVKGSASFSDFQKEPNLFDIYHQGFREQASHWPENPLDTIINAIKKKHTKAIVADMGCGDARLASTLLSTNKVYSFDLVSTNPLVTAADIAHVPLDKNSVDVVVFCLSLMGTNIGEFLLEAHRILKRKGILKIAEVRSRFHDDSGIKAFLVTLKAAGFDIIDKSMANKMFFSVDCVKSDDRIPNIDKDYSAKACLYKRR